MVELLKRNPVAEDVQEILCGPRLQDFPPEATSQLRLLEQAKANRLEFVKMIESIISIKEYDEREDQATSTWAWCLSPRWSSYQETSQTITANWRRTVGPTGRNAGPKEERATDTPTSHPRTVGSVTDHVPLNKDDTKGGNDHTGCLTTHQPERRERRTPVGLRSHHTETTNNCIVNKNEV